MLFGQNHLGKGGLLIFLERFSGAKIHMANEFVICCNGILSPIVCNYFLMRMLVQVDFLEVFDNCLLITS